MVHQTGWWTWSMVWIKMGIQFSTWCSSTWTLIWGNSSKPIVKLVTTFHPKSSRYNFFRNDVQNFNFLLDTCVYFYQHCFLLLMQSLMYQLCKGVAFCHAHGVLHMYSLASLFGEIKRFIMLSEWIFILICFRDLKPHNLLMDRKTLMLKIADLGLARTFTVPIKKYTPELSKYSWSSCYACVIEWLIVYCCNHFYNCRFWPFGIGLLKSF